MPHSRATSHHGFTTSVEKAQQRKTSEQLTLGAKRKKDVVDSQQDSRAVKYQTIKKLVASVIHDAEPAEQSPQAERPLSTPWPSQNPLLSLSHPAYGLPSKLIDNFENLGVTAIYPWQSSCLLGRGLLNGQQNLIYTAPTGGGKSLVADVLMLRRIIDKGKAILVLPYVALVQEKTKWLRRVAEGLPIRVAGLFGGSKAQALWSDIDVAVCTIEKANMLINAAIEEGLINELGVLVMDELHMLDDEHRGYLLELMATKLLAVGGIQIVGMSATLSNPKLLADWLRAKFYVAKYRPIPIEEHIVYNNIIYPVQDASDFLRTTSQLFSQSTQKPLRYRRKIAESSHQALSNPMINSVVALAVETVSAGYGALVFCSSRQSSQTVASLISQAIPAELVEQRLEVLAALEALSGGFENAFTQTIPAGVGFHHAGLTTEEREIVTDAYCRGVLKVMVATCSLAAGINLPARRVILYGARMGRDLVGPAMLRQMRGRAGRKGKDEVGETYLCCQKDDLEAVAEMLEAELPPVISCLVPEKRGLKRTLLEAICVRLVSRYESIQAHIQNSLLWQTTDHVLVKHMMDAALQSLSEEGLIEPLTDQAYAPTRIGCAVVASGFGPEDGLFIHKDLRKAISSFVMDSDLHIFYLFTPIPQASNNPLTSDISWPEFRTLLDTLDEPSLRTLQQIGISPALVNQMAQSGLPDLKETNPAEIHIAKVYRRVYSTFVLRDLCNEIPVSAIALKYSLPRGQIQNLAQTCHGFAAGMIKFCQRMATSIPSLAGSTAATRTLDPSASGFFMLGAVLEHMQDRLRAGARADLLEMAQVTFVKGRMARVLYENGFKGVRALAIADPKRDILPIMMALSNWKTKVRPQWEPDRTFANDKDEPDAQQEQEQEIRKKKLEEKLLAKAEVLVKSAGRIWEQECLKQVLDAEE